MKGIDVSAHQGNINWDAVKASGIEFAIIRISYGQSAIDSKAIRNIEECNYTIKNKKKIKKMKKK